MAIVLALLTFVILLGVGYAVRRAGRGSTEAGSFPVLSVDPVLGVGPEVEPVWVAGYRFPEHLHYHLGHTWARTLASRTAAVGLDDFAQNLIGSVERFELPPVGAWLRQGDKGFGVWSGKRFARLLAPVEGEVIAVNPEVDRDPQVVGKDPYGRGWLFKVRSPNLAANLRNLLSGSVARRWMEEAGEQLELQLMAFKGSVLQDGGQPAPDLADHLNAEEWRQLVQSFFRT